MTQTATAHHPAAAAPHTRARRRTQARPRARLPSWSVLATAAPNAAARGGAQKPPAWSYAGWLFALALALHAIVVVVANRAGDAEPAKPRPRQLAMEFVKPPEPPKIEPPKPEPPKPKPQKQQIAQPVKTVPPIETAPPQPSTDAVASGEVVAAPVAGPPAPEPAPELPVTPPEGRAGYLDNPAPDYPSIALRQGWEGTVLLKVRVLASGNVASVEVQKTSGRKLLDDEAVRAVRRWQFSPSKRGDVAIDGWATVPIEFKLDA